jgi:hypothetical protein
MSGTPTERQLREELDDLDHAGDRPGADAVRVEWRDAAPDERPDGMTWRPAPDDGDEPALLGFDVWQAQRDTLDAVDSGDHDIVAFLAGYGSGKSVFGARWLLTQALEYPGSKFLAMGQDFKKARDTTFTKLFAQLPGERTTLTTSGFNGPESSPIVADYNRQAHRLTLTNDTVIVLGSADKYNRYAGAEFGGVWMDEPSHYGDDLHELTGMITTRLRGAAGPKTQVWTLTGEGYNAAWEILEQRQDAAGEPIGLDVDVVRASVLDNPYLTDGDKARFRRKYEDTAKEQQALHGGFAAATGLVYSDFSRDTHVIEHADAVARVTDGWRIYGYDAGWNDPRVVLELGKTSYDQLVVLDEFVASGTHVSDAIAWLDRHDKPTGTIYCEHEPADIEKFRSANYRAEKADKSLDAGIAEVRKRLQSDGNAPVDQSSDLPSPTWGRGDDDDQAGGDTDADTDDDGRVGLLVSARCEQTIREFLGYKESHVGSSAAEDHCLDSLRYAVMGGSDGSDGYARTSENAVVL